MAIVYEDDKGLITSGNRLLYVNEYNGYYTLCMVSRGYNEVLYLQKCWPIEWRNGRARPLEKDTQYQKAQPMVLKTTLGKKEEAIELLEQAIERIKEGK